MPELRWTDEQARVLLADGDVLLSAGAGTGKTRTIVGKIAWLLGLDVGRRIDGRPVPRCREPCGLAAIAAITFTEKAACELKQRLREEIERSERADELCWELDRAAVGTIHGFCADLLRDHALRLGIDPTFRILDERESALHLNEVIRGRVMEALAGADDGLDRLLERFGLYDRGHATGLIGAVAAVVREVRWNGDLYEPWLSRPSGDGAGPRRLDPDRILELARGAPGDPLAAAAAEAAESEALELARVLYDLARGSVHGWLAWMEEENVRDFDSLILDVRRLLTNPRHRPALASIRRGLRILVIDEFQDTDGAQRDIAFALAGIGPFAEPGEDALPQLLLVGDPKQSIYGFRGADVAVWNEVRRTLCGDDPPLELTENFRTQPGVVDFINRAASTAIETTAAALDSIDPALAVGYSPLVAHRTVSPGQGVDWLDTTVEGTVAEQCALEAALVVSRVRALLADGRVSDDRAPDGQRPVRRADIAVLGRTRRALDDVGRALRGAGIAAHNASSLGLADRQDVLDLVTVLRLLADPGDDYHALGYLRSPFVGLRDEVIARMRLDPGAGRGPLLRQAARWLRRVEAGEVEWYEAPEHPRIAEVEREALARGLEVLREAQALADRAEHSELLEEVVRHTGYRLHLMLRPASEEALAAMERFGALLDEYRHLSVRGFLALWDRWSEQDPGLPQSALYGAADDVVTLQTIHTAKGLEWPIVFLVRAAEGHRDRLANHYLTDPRLGPVLMPSKPNRGPRSAAIAARALAAERAEEARLLYVALTRARDRLVVAAPDAPSGYMEFLRPGLQGATLPHLVVDEPARPGRRVPPRAHADDPVTRTGGQIEVFPEDAGGQLDIFRHARPSAAAPGPKGDGAAGQGTLPLRPVVYRTPDPEQRSIELVPVALEWLDGLRAAGLPPLARPVEAAWSRSVTSATELQLRAADPAAWRLRYVHGVEEAWRFAPRPEGREGIPPALRGTIIHGVLERIRAVDELSRLLNETIAEADAPPDAEELLEQGTTYRAALEKEIERVVTGERWRWYVAGRHHRELPFLVLAGGPPWRTGTLDLYRPEGDGWVVDFKTHRVGPREVAGLANAYVIQADLYRDAVSVLSGRTPQVLLHFTHPDEAVEL